MNEQASTPLPPQAELAATLQELSRRVAASSAALNDDLLDELARTMEKVELFAEQARLTEARARRRRTAMPPLRLGAIVATALKRLREECGVTQAELADDMARLGFVTWKRITVAETESGKRRPTWEELLGYCVLFAIPLMSIIDSEIDLDDMVVLNERQELTDDEFSYLVRGQPPRDGYWLHEMGSIDLAAATVIGGSEDTDWRPQARKMRMQSIHTPAGAPWRRSRNEP